MEIVASLSPHAATFAAGVAVAVALFLAALAATLRHDKE